MDKNLSSLITIFGGTGDLSYRKLLPSIFNLYKKGHFKKLVIISTGLEDISDEEYRSKVKQILLSQENFEMVNLFLDNIFYFQQNVEDKTSWNKLKELSNDIDKKYCLDGNRLFYLAMYPSPNDDNGYDISDYKGIMSEFGTMNDFDQLLSSIHQRGMKLILDLVVNHTSDEHPWFIESKSSKASAKRNWYIWADPKPDGSEPNNWESIFNGSTWEFDESTKQYYFHLFSKKQPDLNWENPDVRQAVFEMMNWWFEKGIDGFRVDAITHIKKNFEAGDLPVPDGKKFAPAFDVDMNQPGIQEWLQEMKDKSLSRYDIMTVGEANGVTPNDAEEWVGEENGKFNMIFQFEHLGLWSTGDTKFDVKSYKQVLNRWQKQLENVGWNALFIENHDQPRRVSTWGDDKNYWYESATSHATAYFLQQGTPFIYQGQEIGMTNYPFESIESFNDVAVKTEYQIVKKEGGDVNQLLDKYKMENRDNARTPMQWNNSINAGFTTGKPWFHVNPNYTEINVKQQLNDKFSILSYYL